MGRMSRPAEARRSRNSCSPWAPADRASYGLPQFLAGGALPLLPVGLVALGAGRALCCGPVAGVQAAQAVVDLDLAGLGLGAGGIAVQAGLAAVLADQGGNDVDVVVRVPDRSPPAAGSAVVRGDAGGRDHTAGDGRPLLVGEDGILGGCTYGQVPHVLGRTAGSLRRSRPAGPGAAGGPGGWLRGHVRDPARGCPTLRRGEGRCALRGCPARRGSRAGRWCVCRACGLEVSQGGVPGFDVAAGEFVYALGCPAHGGEDGLRVRSVRTRVKGLGHLVDVVADLAEVPP